MPATSLQARGPKPPLPSSALLPNQCFDCFIHLMPHHSSPPIPPRRLCKYFFLEICCLSGLLPSTNTRSPQAEPHQHSLTKLLLQQIHLCQLIQAMGNHLMGASNVYNVRTMKMDRCNKTVESIESAGLQFIHPR